MSNPIHIHIPQTEDQDYPLGQPILIGSSLIAVHYMRLNAWLARKNNDYAVSVLKAACIRYAEISYSGCGDSGQIDSIELLSAAREPVNVEGAKPYDIGVYKAEQTCLDVSQTDLPASHYLDSVITIDPVVPDPRPANWNWPRYDRKGLVGTFLSETCQIEEHSMNGVFHGFNPSNSALT